MSSFNQTTYIWSVFLTSHLTNRGIPTIMGESVVAEITTDGCAGTSAEVRYLEHVQARVSLRFLPRGNINIKLISPSGNFGVHCRNITPS